tara:strand:+ start:1226 stop:1426 length:201 start_codon:yes stop_codon:yes gene_type:complete
MCGGGSKAAPAAAPAAPSPLPPPPPPRKVATLVENPLAIGAIAGDRGKGRAGLTNTPTTERGVRIA